MVLVARVSLAWPVQWEGVHLGMVRDMMRDFQLCVLVMEVEVFHYEKRLLRELISGWLGYRISRADLPNAGPDFQMRGRILPLWG